VLFDIELLTSSLVLMSILSVSFVFHAGSTVWLLRVATRCVASNVPHTSNVVQYVPQNAHSCECIDHRKDVDDL
jgi:hypothetical protein